MRENLSFSEQQLELIAANRRKVWFRILKTCLFIQDLDPFAVFRTRTGSGSSRARRLSSSPDNLERGQLGPKAQIGRYSDGLKLPQMEVDRIRTKLAKFTRSFAAYFYTKTLLIALVQFSLLKHQQSEPGEWAAFVLGPAVCGQLVQLLGNPLESLKDISILCYVSPSGYMFVCSTLISLYYKRRWPLDNSPLRLLLAPQYELKRVDLGIRSKLDILCASFSTYRLESWRCFQRIRQRSLSSGSVKLFKQNLAARIQMDRLQMREEKFIGQMQRLLDELRSNPAELVQFRPANLSLDYYAKLAAIAGLTVPYFFANFVTVAASYGGPFIYLPYAARCPQLDCTLAQVYSLPELLLSLEIWLTLGLCVLFATRNLSLLVLLVINQLKLIKETGRQLAGCRELILVALDRAARQPRDQLEGDRTFELALLEANQVGQIRAILEREHQLRSRFFSNDDELHWQRDGRLSEGARNTLVLKNLLKLMVSDHELGRNSRCISMEVGEQFYYVFMTLFLIAVHNQFRMPETDLARTCIVLVTWLEMNLVTVACAYCHSRLLELKRNFWPLLAASLQLYQDCYTRPIEGRQHAIELAKPLAARWQRQSSSSSLSRTATIEVAPAADERQSLAQLKCCSFVIDRLAKLVHLSSLNADAHCPRVLNIKLDYERIIQVNFFVVFVYSFTMQAG